MGWNAGTTISYIQCWNHTYMGWVDTLSRCRATSYTIHEFLLASPTMRYFYIKEEQVGIATAVFKRHAPLSLRTLSVLI